MKFNIEIKEEAREEIASTYLFYEFTRKGLGKRFLDSFEDAVDSISINPFGYSKKHKNFRFKLVKPFPYLIIFEIELTRVIIYQVILAKRHPSKRFKK